jgi:hypothetical protein
MGSSLDSVLSHYLSIGGRTAVVARIRLSLIVTADRISAQKRGGERRR